MESGKLVLKNLLKEGSNGETDIENRLVDLGRGEERGKCMETVTWKLTLPTEKQTANGNRLYG